MDSHTTKIRQAFRHLVPFLRKYFFWELMSVDMRVILLVKGDKTLYIPCKVGNSWGSHVQDGYKCVNEEMDSHTTKIRRAFRHLVPFLKDFWERMSVDMRVILLVEGDKTIYIPCRVGNSWGFHVYVHDGYKRTNKKMDSHTTQIRRAFRRSIPFWKIFGNQCRSMWGSYFWLNTTRLYTSHVEFETLGVFMCMYMMVTSVPTKRWTLTLPKFDEPFGVRFHFERFLGTGVGQCEGHTFG